MTSTTLDAVTQLLAPESRRDPFPLLNRLRVADPVHRTPTGTYLVSQHDDVTRVLQDSGSAFLAPDLGAFEARFPGILQRPSIAIFASSIALANPPRHTRLRKAISREFTARRVDGIRARIESICDGLLTAISEPLLDGAEVDLQASLAEPLTIATLAELLGVPEADRAWLASLVEGVLSAFPGAPDAVLDVADENTVQIENYLTELIAQRRRDPRDDLTTALATSNDGEQLAEDEIVPMLWALWCAGFKTSAAGISTGARLLLAHPDRFGDVTAFVNETLRYDPPTILTPFVRVATRDVKLSGGTIPAGGDVRLAIGAANRDPAVFADPDRFDPTRDTKASLTFAGGIHFCVGALLARTEMSVALTGLRTRFPRLTAAGEPTWSEALFHHMVRKLPVKC